MRKKLWKMFKRLAALMLMVIVGALILLRMQHNLPTALPLPAGKFLVGRTSFDWIDAARIDPFAPQRGAKRELTVWVWYPASPEKSSRTATYVPAVWRAALARYEGTVFQNLLQRDTSLVRCHSYENAEVAPDQPTYPVILMKPGIGALALDYAALCEDLASRGYIVVASDSPYNTFLVVYQDGRIALRNKAAFPGQGASDPVIGAWTADNRFLLDRLTQLNRSDPAGRFQGRLNLNEVGVLGHSFGGATAAEFCSEDSRCKAGIDVDGRLFGQVVHAGIHRPFMFLMADHSGPLDAEERRIMAEIQSVYDRLPSDRRYVALRDSGHFNFSDTALLLNGLLMRASGATGKIDARRGLKASAACIGAFFDVHLKGADPALMNRLPAHYPELRLENGVR
jgi:hypothetical protein